MKNFLSLIITLMIGLNAWAAPAHQAMRANSLVQHKTVVTVAEPPCSTCAEYYLDENAIEEQISNAEKTTVTLQTNTADSNQQVIAILLCFFLGGLGLHRLYLGARGIVILWYVLTCGGIFGIVPLVDFILLIFSGTSRFEGKSSLIAW
jgi:TM2 domain-containing membrane protein YozV